MYACICNNAPFMAENEKECEAFADIDLTEKTNEVTKVFLGAELADAIFACPSSFGGYQKIDTATFFS